MFIGKTKHTRLYSAKYKRLKKRDMHGFKIQRKKNCTEDIQNSNRDTNYTITTYLLGLGAVPEPNADWPGCCPNTGGCPLLDTVPKVGGAGWEPAENNAPEDDIDPKPGGLGWLAPWLCPNVGVWLAPNAGLAEGAEAPVPNTKEDPRDPETHFNQHGWLNRRQSSRNLCKLKCTYQDSLQTLTLLSRSYQDKFWITDEENTMLATII